jgi:hypothetical protein
MTLRRHFLHESRVHWSLALSFLFLLDVTKPIIRCADLCNPRQFFLFLFIFSISAPKCKHSCHASKKQSFDSIQSTLPSFREGSLCEQPLFRFQTLLSYPFKLTSLVLLQDLFGQIGRVKKAFIHLGPTGKSTGVADIIYDGPRDAEKALNTYNNIELDRKLGFILNVELF